MLFLYQNLSRVTSVKIICWFSIWVFLGWIIFLRYNLINFLGITYFFGRNVGIFEKKLTLILNRIFSPTPKTKHTNTHALCNFGDVLKIESVLPLLKSPASVFPLSSPLLTLRSSSPSPLQKSHCKNLSLQNFSSKNFPPTATTITTDTATTDIETVSKPQ